MVSLIKALFFAGVFSAMTQSALAANSNSEEVETPSPQEIEICLEIIAELMAEAKELEGEDFRVEQDEAQDFCRSGAFFAAIDEAFGEEGNDLDDQFDTDEQVLKDRPDWIK